MARRIGRAWGNALGGYKFQRRSKGGQFSSGFVGSVPTSSLSKGQRRAQYLQKQKRKKTAKKAAVIAGGVAVAAGAGYVGYKNRGAIQMATSNTIKRRTKEMPAVSYDVGSQTEKARDWMRANSVKRARNTNSSSSISPAMKIVAGTGVAANAARNVAATTRAVSEVTQTRRQPERQISNSGGNSEMRAQWENTFKRNLTMEGFGAGLNKPIAAPIPKSTHQDINPKGPLAGDAANRQKAAEKARKLHEDKMANARRKTAGGYKNMRGEMKDNGNNFHGGEFSDSEQFDNMFDGEQRYVKPEAFGPSKGINTGQRTHRNPAGQQALIGAARQGVRNRKMHELRHIEGLSDPRYRGGVSDATIKSVLPEGMKTTSQPLYTVSTPENPHAHRLFQGPQGKAKGTQLAKTQGWFEAKRRAEYEKLALSVPQVDAKYGTTLAITKNYDFVDKKGKRVKGTKIEGAKFEHPTYKQIAQPWEDILAKEGLGMFEYNGPSMTERAGRLHGATNTISYGGAFEDESWKFKNRRA